MFGELREIVGVENIPEHGKFRVLLKCGHSILYDHSVDFASEYFQPQQLICRECGFEDRDNDQ